MSKMTDLGADPDRELDGEHDGMLTNDTDYPAASQSQGAMTMTTMTGISPTNGRHHLSVYNTDDNDPFAARRILRFFVFAFIFWSVVLFLTYEHEERILILVLVALCLVLLYLVGSICFMITSTLEYRSLNGVCAKPDDSGSSSLLTHIGNDMSTTTTRHAEIGGVDGSDDGTFGFSFEDTARQIRSAADFDGRHQQQQHRRPRDGTYKVVYTAVVFGRVVRSEGVLQLRFGPNTSMAGGGGGWDIKGTSVFGGSSQPILDGYVNETGQMYWIVAVKPLLQSFACTNSAAAVAKTTSGVSDGRVGETVVYRGLFNFETCCLNDGEFQSINSSTSSGDSSHNGSSSSSPSRVMGGRAHGRVVRLEWMHDAKTKTSNLHNQIGSSASNHRVQGSSSEDECKYKEKEMEMAEIRQ